MNQQQTIFNTYVLMQSQSDCDEAKAICVKYGLPIYEKGFDYILPRYIYFTYSGSGDFWIQSNFLITNKTEITLTRFKELCEEWKQLNE